MDHGEFLVEMFNSVRDCQVIRPKNPKKILSPFITENLKHTLKSNRAYRLSSNFEK